MLHRFLSCVSLITRVPVKLTRDPDYSLAYFFFPFTGLLIAIIAVLSGIFANLIFGSMLAVAFVMLLAEYLIANLFHLDGLMDTADASGVFGDKAKRYEVLKDSRIGAYGFFAGTVCLAGKFMFIYLLLLKSPTDAYAGMLLMLPASRFAGLLVSVFGKPLNSTGLASAIEKFPMLPLVLSFSACSVPAFALLLRAGNVIAAFLVFLCSGISAVAASGYISSWFQKHIGGYNGDAMGAAIELTELLSAGLFLACFNFLIPA